MTETMTQVATHYHYGDVLYARWLGRCKDCKTLVRKEYADGEAPLGWYIAHQQLIPCPNCRNSSGGPRYVAARMVVGRMAEQVSCGARCTNAVGPNCDCSCAGKNHGSGR